MSHVGLQNTTTTTTITMQLLQLRFWECIDPEGGEVHESRSTVYRSDMWSIDQNGSAVHRTRGRQSLLVVTVLGTLDVGNISQWSSFLFYWWIVLFLGNCQSKQTACEKSQLLFSLVDAFNQLHTCVVWCRCKHTQQWCHSVDMLQLAEMFNDISKN